MSLAGWAAPVVDMSELVITLNRTQLDYTGQATRPVITAISAGDLDDIGTKLTIQYYKKTAPDTYSPIGEDAVKNVGDYAIALEGNGTDYPAETSPKVDFTINPGTLHIHFADFTEKVYGDADPTVLEYTWDDPSELVGFDDVNNVVLTFTLLREDGENVGEYAYTTKTVTTANYNVVAAGNPKLKITKAPLTVTYTGDIVKNYGEANPVLNPASATFDGWTGAENDGVNDAAEKAALIASGSLAYTQNEVNANADKDGNFLSGISEGYPLTFTGFDLQNYEVSLPANKTMKIKQVELAATPATLPANNYFTYTKPEGTFTYNGANQAPEYVVKYKDAQGVEHTLDATQVKYTYKYSATESGTYLATTDFKDAGYYKATVEAKATGNYSGTVADVAGLNFAIGKRDLWIYVAEKTKVYDGTGYNLATLTKTDFEFNGLQGADNSATFITGITGVSAKWWDASASTPSYTTETSKNVNTTGYVIEPNIASTSNLHTNYTPKALNTGKFKITARPVTATAKPQTISFGDPVPTWANTTTFIDLQAAPVYPETGDYGVISGEEGTVLAALSIGLDEEHTLADTYTDAIVITDAGTATNYAIETVPGTYTIAAAAFTMIAQNKTITYGTAYTMNDFVCVTSGPDPKKNAVFMLKQGTDEWRAGDELPTTAGTYDLVIIEDNGYLPDNYELPITYVPGTFTIAQKEITITPNPVTLNVDATKATLNKYGTVSYGEPSGLVGDDVISYELSFGTGVTTTTGGDLDGSDAAGSYPNAIKVTAPDAADGFANANYKINVATGNLTLIAAASLVLDDTDTKLSEKIKDANGTPVSASFTTRQLKKEVWNVLVLPFATSAKEVSEKLGYAVVNVLDETKNDGDVHMKLHMGDIKANQPFLVKNYDDVDLDGKTFTGKTIVYDPTNADANAIEINEEGNSFVADAKGNQFIGVYNTASVWGAEYKYVTASGVLKDAAKFTETKPCTIKPLRAYFKLQNAAARIFIEEPDGTITAIGGINVDGEAVPAEGWYNLNGVKMQGAPSQKGVYIQNGKKVVIK